MFYLDGKTEAEKNFELNYIKEQCEILKLAIEPVLSKQDYFFKSGFSAVDIMMAAVLPGAEEFLAPAGSGTARFLERMRARPLAKKVEVFA
jgi:glutathione S-transferase